MDTDTETIIPVPSRESLDRDVTIATIRKALRKRSGKMWSVTGGTGTAWGWITVQSPPARRVRLVVADCKHGCTYAVCRHHDERVAAGREELSRNGRMSDADTHELGGLLGVVVGHDGYSIPASQDYREEAVLRAITGQSHVAGKPYWD